MWIGLPNLIFLGDKTSGEISYIPPGEEAPIRSRIIFGIGRTDVTVNIKTENGGTVIKSVNAFILGFYIYIRSS